MKFYTAALLLCFSALLPAQELTVPELPADHVLDQTGKVTTEERKQVSAALHPSVEKDGLGVYLVLLNSASEEPPADVARRLSQNWQGTADRVVVLTAPDLDPPLLVEIAGVTLGSLSEDSATAMKDDAIAAGAKATSGLPAMLATAGSIVSTVRQIRNGAATPAVILPPAPAERDWPQFTKWISSICLSVSLLALLALFLLRGRMRHALIFPLTDFRHRFSAPHSGGNDAVVSFAKKG